MVISGGGEVTRYVFSLFYLKRHWFGTSGGGGGDDRPGGNGTPGQFNVWFPPITCVMFVWNLGAVRCNGTQTRKKCSASSQEWMNRTVHVCQYFSFFEWATENGENGVLPFCCSICPVWSVHTLAGGTSKWLITLIVTWIVARGWQYVHQCLPSSM